jgi:hypothetical protein
MIVHLGQIIFLGAVWGVVWACFMQFTAIGWLVSTKQTWLGVVIGCGGNLIILAMFMPLDQWIMLGAVFAASAVPVAMRSLHNQNKEFEGIWRQVENLQEQQG